MYLTQARLTILPRRREASLQWDSQQPRGKPPMRLTRVKPPGGVGRMGMSPDGRQGHPQATCHKPAARSEIHGRRLLGPGERHLRF